MKRNHVRARLEEVSRVATPPVRAEFADALEERLRAATTPGASRTPAHRPSHVTGRRGRMGRGLNPVLASVVALALAGAVLWAAPGSGPGHEVGLGGRLGSPGPVIELPSPDEQDDLPGPAPWTSPAPSGDPRPPSGESETPTSPGAESEAIPGPDATRTSAPWPTEAATEPGPGVIGERDGGQTPSENPSPSAHDSHPRPPSGAEEEPQTGYAGPSETHPVSISAQLQADQSVLITWSVYDRGEFDSYIVIRSSRPYSPAWPRDDQTQVVARVARDQPCAAHDRPASPPGPVYRVVVLDAGGQEVARSHAVMPAESPSNDEAPRRPGAPITAG